MFVPLLLLLPLLLVVAFEAAAVAEDEDEVNDIVAVVGTDDCDVDFGDELRRLQLFTLLSLIVFSTALL